MNPVTDAPSATARMSFWQVVRTRDNAWAALKVSLLVGSVLNLLNNGPAWWHGDGVSL